MKKVTMKPFKQLTLMDDFLFSVASEDMMFCKACCRRFLGKRSQASGTIKICRNEAGFIKA